MNSFNFREENLTGTIINYYIHCKRQCWLFAHKLNLEDNSELVKLGRAIHKEKQTQEIEIDNIKIDKITEEYLIEIKKGDADIDACRGQILFYLQKLKQKGINRKGRLEIIKKKTKTRKIHTYELNQETEYELNQVKNLTIRLLNQEKIPAFVRTNKCKNCAYYPYCSI